MSIDLTTCAGGLRQHLPWCVSRHRGFLNNHHVMVLQFHCNRSQSCTRKNIKVISLSHCLSPHAHGGMLQMANGPAYLWQWAEPAA